MKNNKRYSIRLLTVLVGLTGIATGMGFGCGLGFEPVGLDKAKLGLDLDGLNVISGAKTTSTVYADQVLESMVAAAGIQNPSAATMNQWNIKKGGISEGGRADKLNAPMSLSVAAVGSEICNDLITEELPKSASNRRVFNSVDFSSTVSSSMTDAAMGDMVRRLARSFWSRNESAEELAIIKSAINDAIPDGNNDVAATRGMALYTCTAMISSLDAIEM